MLDTMCMALGGRAAEELSFGSVTTGASDDLNRVTQMAYAMCRIYGFNDRIGNLSFPPRDGEMEMTKPYSDHMAEVFDEEVKKLVSEAYERTKSLLREREKELSAVGELLLKKETINRDDVVKLIGERPFGAPPSSYTEAVRKAEEMESGATENGNEDVEPTLALREEQKQ